MGQDQGTMQLHTLSHMSSVVWVTYPSLYRAKSLFWECPDSPSRRGTPWANGRYPSPTQLPLSDTSSFTLQLFLSLFRLPFHSSPHGESERTVENYGVAFQSWCVVLWHRGADLSGQVLGSLNGAGWLQHSIHPPGPSNQEQIFGALTNMGHDVHPEHTKDTSSNISPKALTFTKYF